jgi:hypothetical protein
VLEKVTSVATAIIGLAVVAVIFRSPRTRGVLREIFGGFTGAIKSAASAGAR